MTPPPIRLTKALNNRGTLFATDHEKYTRAKRVAKGSHWQLTAPHTPGDVTEFLIVERRYATGHPLSRIRPIEVVWHLLEHERAKLGFSARTQEEQRKDFMQGIKEAYEEHSTSSAPPANNLFD